MKTAEKIMKKQSYYKAEIDKVFGKADSDALWNEANEKLTELLKKYSTLPKGVRLHTDNKILPAAAIYLTLKEKIGQEQAYELLKRAAQKKCAGIEKKLQAVLKPVFMQNLFISVWDLLTKKVFGPSNGFKNVFYPKKKGEYRMDVTECPYLRYFTEAGCPEITRLSCDCDEWVYGRLPGLRFERSGTLGKGAERCDFCIRKL